jgi:hypothetical protein
MAFQFIPLRGAVDDERHIVVRESSRFYDDLIDRIHFVCRWGDTKLEFVAVCEMAIAPRVNPQPVTGHVQKWRTAYHIEESSLREALAEESSRGAFIEAEYIDIRNGVRDGLFMLITEGGTNKSLSPEFMVDFRESKR